MKILLSWSSGKDSAWALHVLNQTHPGAVAGLLTTVNETVDRVAMHAVRRSVIEAQAAAAALPLRTVVGHTHGAACGADDRSRHPRRIVCVDTRVLDARFVGREFDRPLLRDLPASVDPCAEKGEFHTCVYAGPMFRAPLELDVGELVAREPFTWCDLVLREPSRP